MPKNSLSDASIRPQWWRSSCRPASSAKILDISAYGRINSIPTNSPIDQYLSRSEEIIRFGSQTLLDTNPEIANLLFVGVIAQTENYFRELFAKLLQICPTSQIKSSTRDIKLGSVLWHKSGVIERGAFEAFSFASSENIIDTIRKYFDIGIDSKSDSFALLREFDQLCELRHAIVHSGGIMSGKNSLKLKLPRTEDNFHVQMNFSSFQEASSICTALVYSINTELFHAFGNRWRDDWPKLLHKWDSTTSNRAFTDLWNLFSSTTDMSRGTILGGLSRLECKKEVLKP